MEQVSTIPCDLPDAAAAHLPRVLYAVVMDPSQKFGSMEEQMASLARVFEEENGLFLPLFIWAGNGKRPTPLEIAGVKIASVDMRQFRFKALLELLSLIRRYRIDIVHWNFSPSLTNSYLWWLTLLKPGVKHYFTDHISRTFPLAPAESRGLKKRAKRLLLKRYAKVLCVSQFVFDNLAAQGVWSNLVCCKHFINTNRFEPNLQIRDEIRSRFQADNRFVLLTVAHLIKEKGIDVVLRALTLLPDEVVLWVVGTGAEANELRALAQELGVLERTTFHGSQEHVEPFMQGADCFVCPSRWAEAAGLVNLEAQASGLPVIASNIGGIPEYVADGETGFLFPPGDAVELASRVRRLLADPALRRQFSQAARNLAEEQFSPAVRLPEMVALYRDSI